MKITKYLSLTVAVIGMFAGNAAFAQGGTYSKTKVIVTFSVFSEGEEITKTTKTRSGTTTTTSKENLEEKWSNKQILTLLKDEYYNEAMGGTIDKWSIELISYDGRPQRFALIKEGKEPIFLDRILNFDFGTCEEELDMDIPDSDSRLDMVYLDYDLLHSYKIIPNNKSAQSVQNNTYTGKGSMSLAQGCESTISACGIIEYMNRSVRNYSKDEKSISPTVLTDFIFTSGVGTLKEKLVTGSCKTTGPTTEFIYVSRG